MTLAMMRWICFIRTAGIEDLLRLRIERAQRGHRGDEPSHRMSVVAERIDELAEVLVEDGVVGDGVRPLRRARSAVGSSPCISRYATSR